MNKKQIKQKMDKFFKGQKISLKKKNTILPKEIQDYTERLLDSLKEGLLRELNTPLTVKAKEKKC